MSTAVSPAARAFVARAWDFIQKTGGLATFVAAVYYIAQLDATVKNLNRELEQLRVVTAQAAADGVTGHVRNDAQDVRIASAEHRIERLEDRR